MTELMVNLEYDGRVRIGFAVPGFDASKWQRSEKYWFSISQKQARELALRLLGICEGLRGESISGIIAE